MKKVSSRFIVGIAAVLLPALAHAQLRPATPDSGLRAAVQQNVPQPVREAQRDVERTVRRYGVGVSAGVGLDPEIIHVGAHGTFGPIFRQAAQFRPGVEIGVGELTTLLAFNFDVLYTFDNESRDSAWLPYVGAGPTLGLVHKGFESEDLDHLDIEGLPDELVQSRNRFDFGDTDFNGGMNFIVGMRKQRGPFFEMRATAWGASTIRLLGGFNF